MFKGSTMDRSGIQSVLNDAKNGEMDILLMLGVSRLGRNTIEIVRTFCQLEEYGVEIETVHEGASLSKLLGFVK
jgi:DNA invertase Pin-like site-specific DNA recombinase